jgi:putative membrane protein
MTYLIAESWGHGHHGWFLLFPLFWLLVLFLFARFFFFWRRGRWGWANGGREPRTDPREILAERYARGEISPEEYRERLANLEQ